MYTIRPILKYLLLAVPGVCGLLLVFFIFRWKQLLPVKQRLKRCIKFLPPVLVTALLGGALCFTYLMKGAPYKGSFKMSYTYPKASKGLTPNSTTLDVNEIFSDQVLEQAAQTGLLGALSSEEIKSTLSISNIRQRGVVSADELYVSTEYMISYEASDTSASVGKEAVLKAVADSYYDYFVSKYGRKTDILENDYSEMTQLDYLDINTYLYRQISGIMDYMEMCSRESSAFVSEKTDESFDTIRDKAKYFRDVSLERNKAYILKYGISKNKEQYISRLNYGNRLENVEYLKNLAAYRVRLSAIARYDRDITRAVLVPTRDDDGEFYQSRTKIGTDFFFFFSDKHLTYATDNQLTIETNNYYIERLSSAPGDSSHRQKAEEMVEALKKEIETISYKAAETVKDYDEQTSNGYISFIFQDETGYLRSCIKKTVYYVIGLAGILLGLIFTSTWNRPERKTRLRGERCFRT